MSNVIKMGGITRANLPPDHVLEAAKGHIDEAVVVIGWDIDGEPYYAASISDKADILLLLELCKKRLLEDEPL